MSELHVEHPARLREMGSLRAMTLVDALYVAAHASDEERGQVQALTGRPFDVDGYAMACAQRDTRYTITAPDGEQVMVGGFDFVHPRLARCWSLSTDRWPECVRAVTRVTRQLITMMFDKTQVHRMEILSHGARHGAHHWYTRSLGFTDESVLHRYGHEGEDFVLFARLREAP